MTAAHWTDTAHNVTLYCGDCLEVLPGINVDAIVTDPPFSDRTHKGHAQAVNGHMGDGKDNTQRQDMQYAAWYYSDITRFALVAHKACAGWIVVMNDHVNAPIIESELQAQGRYVFAPLPYYAPGSRVRLAGDGPSSWTIWIVVARTKAQSKWGTLPGGYVYQRGMKREDTYIGGKPVPVMEAIIRDYSKRGQVVCDPYMGTGSTGVAAINMGRGFVGIERQSDVFDQARARIIDAIERKHRAPMLPGVEATK